MRYFGAFLFLFSSVLCFCNQCVDASLLLPDSTELFDTDYIIVPTSFIDQEPYLNRRKLNDILDESPVQDYTPILVADKNDFGDSAFLPDLEVLSPEGVQPSLTVPVSEVGVRDIIEKLNGKVENLMSEVKSQQDKIIELENNNKKMLDKIDLIEQQTKTNNVIFTNVHESKPENHKTTLQKILQIINRVMKLRASADDISVALRAGSHSTNNRPIVVRFTTFATKMKVLGAIGKLSHTNISLTADYSEQVAKIRNDLLPYMYRARGQGYSAFLLYDKLVVNGKVKTLEELRAEDRMEEQHPMGEEHCSDRSISGESNDVDTSVQSDPNEQVEEVEVDPRFQDKEYN